VQRGGEMPLAEWKLEVASKLNCSVAKTIQVVYGLVAHGLVALDRSQQPEARAISLVV
jgi:hypothetical protein